MNLGPPMRGLTFLAAVNNFNMRQELDLGGQPLAALIARPLFLVAVEDAVLQSPVAGPAVGGREPCRAVATQVRLVLADVRHLVTNTSMIILDKNLPQQPS